ncbi:MAG: alpha-mannosidase [Clostridia bacterium]|nr:alpha-mannosidase [Clostridia bacterium]
MKKNLHLICNAHIDPVWQWEWEEGACETLSTFRVAAKFCREFDGFIFCHNEAILYRWVEEYEPALFEEIRELVKLGKWHIMGGWHLQPDCNMPSGEGFVRNILAGRQYFLEKFGVAPTTAINFDPFGHTRGLVQIMAKSGYDSYLFCRPYKTFRKLPSEQFTWVGYDGSEITGTRVAAGYNSQKGKATEKIGRTADELKNTAATRSVCLWGIGNHGGGPSHEDLVRIGAKLAEWENNGVHVIHSTPEAYFADLCTSDTALPRYEGDMNLWAPGCYTSQVKVKQKYRQLENEFFACEKMCSALCADSDFSYPEKEFSEVLYDLLMIQFHDALPGSSIQPVEEMAIRMADHGLEILSRLRAKAFFKFCQNQKAAKDGEIPIMAYNPHPYSVEGDFECEFVLADQNRTGTFYLPKVFRDEKEIPSQPAKEASNIPIDWRKKVVFHAKLPPMQISRFDCRLEELPTKPAVIPKENADHFLIDGNGMQVKINKKTGLMDSCTVNGNEYLCQNAMSIDVYRDDEDPWGMRVRGWNEKIGSFTLLSPEDGSAYSSLNTVIPSVRFIEDGPVRATVEAIFAYSASKAVVRYHISKHTPSVELEIRILNTDTEKLYKLAIPYAMENVRAFSEVAFGEEPFKLDHDENIHHQYVRLEGDGQQTINVYNSGIYASSLKENTLLVSLMRSPAYCAHPVGDAQILPQDRHSAFIDQGERIFHLKLTFGQEAASNGVAAQIYNEKPTVLSFFPSGKYASERQKEPPFRLDSEKIVLSSFKKAENGGGFILRLFNPESMPASCRIRSKRWNFDREISFGAFEVKTFRASDDQWEECNMMEGLIV